ncbi:putative ATP-dependent RNA helicase TDRD12 isoform X2 [Teleopsis dalmanni]|uniref:putative ATP-dependent RNA helicase TDRD12 isoform X2 n=1 Tax=Teleopsis dalmanni TaxID=139649 RepID=UPI0018CCE033|nr:putative ATP-dependent RNA helicase TDRD12 isoform X2 [Teleopsis dalmanni]
MGDDSDSEHEAVLNILRKRSAFIKAQRYLDNAYGTRRTDAELSNVACQRAVVTTNTDTKLSITETGRGTSDTSRNGANICKSLPVNPNVSRFFDAFSGSMASGPQYERLEQNFIPSATKQEYGNNLASENKVSDATNNQLHVTAGKKNKNKRKKKKAKRDKSVTPSNTNICNEEPKVILDYRTNNALQQPIIKQKSPINKSNAKTYSNTTLSLPKSDGNINQFGKIKRPNNAAKNAAPTNLNLSTNQSNEQLKMLPKTDERSTNTQLSTDEQNKPIRKTIAINSLNTTRSSRLTQQIELYYKRTVETHFTKDDQYMSSTNRDSNNPLNDNKNATLTHSNTNVFNEQQKMCVENTYNGSEQMFTNKPNTKTNSNTTQSLTTNKQVDLYYNRNQGKDLTKLEGNDLSSNRSPYDEKATSAISLNTNCLSQQEKMFVKDIHNRDAQRPKKDIHTNSNGTQSLPINEQVDLYHKRNQEIEFNKTQSHTQSNDPSSFKPTYDQKATSANYSNQQEEMFVKDIHNRNAQRPKKDINSNSNATQSLPINEQVDLYHKRNHEIEFNKTKSCTQSNDPSSFKPTYDQKAASANYANQQEDMFVKDIHNRNTQRQKIDVPSNSTPTQSLPINEQVDLYHKRNHEIEFNKTKSCTQSNDPSSFKPTYDQKAASANYANQQEDMFVKDIHNRNTQRQKIDVPSNSTPTQSLPINEQVDLYHKRNQEIEFNKIKSHSQSNDPFSFKPTYDQKATSANYANQQEDMFVKDIHNRNAQRPKKDIHTNSNATQSLQINEQVDLYHKRNQEIEFNKTQSHTQSNDPFSFKSSYDQKATSANYANQQEDMFVKDIHNRDAQRPKKDIHTNSNATQSLPINEQVDLYHKRNQEIEFNKTQSHTQSNDPFSFKSSYDQKATSANYANQQEDMFVKDIHNRNTQRPKKDIHSNSNATQSLPINEQVDLYHKRNQEIEFNKTKSHTQSNDPFSFKSSYDQKATSANYSNQQEEMFVKDIHNRNAQHPKKDIHSNSNATQSLPINEQVDLFYKRNQEIEFNKTKSHTQSNDPSSFKPTYDQKATSAISLNTNHSKQEEMFVKDIHNKDIQLPKKDIKINSNTNLSLPVSEQVELYYKRNQQNELNKPGSHIPSANSVCNTSSNDITTKLPDSLNVTYNSNNNSLSATGSLSQMKTLPPIRNSSNINALRSAHRPMIDNERAPRVMRRKRILPEPSKCLEKIDKILQSADAQYSEISRLKMSSEISSECFRTSDIRSLRPANPNSVSNTKVAEPSIYQRAVDKLISLKNSITQSLTKDTSNEQKPSSGDTDICLYNMRSIKPNNLILAHSKTDCISLEKLKDMSFYKDISDGMLNLHFNKVYPSQSYAWPHLLRGNSICIINSPKTGKTWCYLPAICQLIRYRIETGRVLSSLGPLAIVLLSKSSDIEMICKYFNILLQTTNLKSICVPCFGARDHSAVKMQLLNGCGILVTTPASLKCLLEDHQKAALFDSNRLCHFVVDGIDEMINNSNNDVEFVVKKVLSIAKKEVLQIVITSCVWTHQLISLLKRSNEMLLLFGDLFEAAFYAKTNITMKLHSSEMKIKSILKYLESNSSSVNRTLIVCDSEEDVEYVANSLKNCGCIAIGFNKNSSINILNLVSEWISMNSYSQVLVCTDITLSELSKLQNVQTLIHYSLPSTWVAFTNRFATMLKSFHNFIEGSFARTSFEKETRSLILLDENTKEEIVRLVEIMQMHGCNISTEILNVTELTLKEIHKSRNYYGQQICPILLECGMCAKSNCSYRHYLNQYDKMDAVPIFGDLRIVVLKVYSPTHFVARLLEHRSNTAEDWQQVCRSSEVSLFLMQLDYYYQNEENLVTHNSPQINDICIYKIANNFHRAKVIGTHKTLSKDRAKNKVTIKLIDIGTTTTLYSNMLYVCDDKFKDFPAQAIDIRLLNIAPYENGGSWDNTPTKVANKFMTQLKETEVVHVKLKFAFANCIWIDNVYVLNFLKCTRIWVHTDNLKNILLRQKLGVVDTKIESRLRKLGEENDVIINHTIQGTNSNNDNFDTPLTPTDTEASTESTLNSAETNSTDNNEGIDYGNGTNDDDFNDKLCNSKVKSIEKWCHISFNELIKVQLGDWKGNDNWSEIYVQLDEPEFRENFMELSKMTKEFVNKFKIDSKYIFPDHLLVPSSDCILKYDEKYLRAKLYNVFENEVGEKMYCFFFCDYACFITVNKDKLYNDFLYETTNEIVDYMPFQAIHCKLSGMDENCSFIDITKEYTFVSAIAKCSNEILNINSYEVLLYESDSLDNVQFMKLLNSNNNRNDKIEKDECEIKKSKIGYNEILEIFQNCLAMDEAETQDYESYKKIKIKPDQVQTENISKSANCVDLKESKGNEEVNSIYENKYQSFTDLPTLKSSYKCPYTIWYQTDVFIFLNINAPDVRKFSIDVTNKTLIFTADLENEKLLLTLNFFGIINPNYYYEVRGLNLVVRLVKSVHMNWPRLIEQNCKFPWLSYNINKIDIKENELLQDFEKNDSTRKSSNEEESELDSEDDNEAYSELKIKDYIDN